jgi:hypothetical protein
MIVAVAEIQAQDSLLWASRLAVGTGRLKQSDASAALRAWRKQAGQGDGRSVRTPAGLMSALAAAGVPVEVVSPKAVTTERPAKAKAS